MFSVFLKDRQIFRG